MFNSLKNALGSLKEKTAEVSAVAYLNERIKGFGEVKRLELNSVEKSAMIEVGLKGEIDPVWVRVDSFAVSEENGKTWVVVNQVKASREWIGLALERYVVGRRLELPGSAAWVLGK